MMGDRGRRPTYDQELVFVTVVRLPMGWFVLEYGHVYLLLQFL